MNPAANVERSTPRNAAAAHSLACVLTSRGTETRIGGLEGVTAFRTSLAMCVLQRVYKESPRGHTPVRLSLFSAMRAGGLAGFRRADSMYGPAAGGASARTQSRLATAAAAVTRATITAQIPAAAFPFSLPLTSLSSLSALQPAWLAWRAWVRSRRLA